MNYSLQVSVIDVLKVDIQRWKSWDKCWRANIFFLQEFPQESLKNYGDFVELQETELEALEEFLRRSRVLEANAIQEFIKSLLESSAVNNVVYLGLVIFYVIYSLLEKLKLLKVWGLFKTFLINDHIEDMLVRVVAKGLLILNYFLHEKIDLIGVKIF